MNDMPPQLPTEPHKPATRQILTLAGGCFWCLEAVYLHVKGVVHVQSGYANGPGPVPSYHQVCGGDTGYAEVVQITYDPRRIHTRDLLEIFFVIHDPTTLNAQGHDIGTQYRSGIYWHEPEQELVAHMVMQEMLASGEYGQVSEQRPWGNIVTELQPIGNYGPAEPHHARYYERNPGQGYCQFVVRPKLEKFQKTFRALSVL